MEDDLKNQGFTELDDEDMAELTTETEPPKTESEKMREKAKKDKEKRKKKAKGKSNVEAVIDTAAKVKFNIDIWITILLIILSFFTGGFVFSTIILGIHHGFSNWDSIGAGMISAIFAFITFISGIFRVIANPGHAAKVLQRRLKNTEGKLGKIAHGVSDPGGDL